MSTKLYHGYRLAEDTDVFTFSNQLRAVMNPIRTRLDAAELMSRAVGKVDGCDRRGEPRPTTALLTAMTDYDSQQAELRPHERGHDPHRFEVAFGRDSSAGGTGRILALLYTDHAAYTAAWEALPEVEPYGYWDNADAPDGVTESEWEDRRQAWERVLPGFAAPVAHMLTFALRSDLHDSGMVNLIVDSRNDPAVRVLLVEAAPSRHDRARALALSLVVEEARRRDPDREPVQVVSRFLFSGRKHARDVIAAAEPCLHDDVAGYVLRCDDDTPVTRPMDLTDAQAAAAAYLDATAG